MGCAPPVFFYSVNLFYKRSSSRLITFNKGGVLTLHHLLEHDDFYRIIAVHFFFYLTERDRS